MMSRVLGRARASLLRKQLLALAALGLLGCDAGGATPETDAARAAALPGQDGASAEPTDAAAGLADAGDSMHDSGAAAPANMHPPAADAGSAGASDASSDAGNTDPGDAGSDEVLDAQVARTDSFWVADGRVHFGERELHLYGVNWFGLETDARALFGVAEAKRSVPDFLAQLKSLGFNALRVPLSPESIDPGFPNPDSFKRGDIDTGREQFEELAQAAKDAGLYMLWDIHTCSSAVGYRKTGPTDPACSGYGEQKWLDNLKTLAALAKSYAPYVLGIDLFNEPYGLTWQAWKALAEEGGRTVLRENPRILTFVEGVGSEGYQDADGVFWGENLSGVKDAPVDLPAARLVYSPHVYGPSVYAQPYFSTSDFPANMPSIWDKHFGYLFAQHAALIPGEFGGMYTGSDKTWQDAFVEYLRTKSPSHSFFYWSLNPNSGDTGGLLLSDWKTVNTDKLNLLKRLQQ